MLTYLLTLTEESKRSSVEKLYYTFHKDALSFAYGRFLAASFPSPETQAEDAVQCAYVKLIKYIDRIDFSVSDSTLRSYVLSIVANEINTIMNETHFDEPLEEHTELSEEDFLDKLAIRDRYAAVLDAIRELDEHYATVLLWYYAAQHSVKEIADLLGITPKTVYTRLARGRQRLLELCEEKGLK